MKIGKNIKVIRVNKEMTQKELADMLGITTTYLSLIENNAKKPSLTLVEKISKTLEIPLAMLFTELTFQGKP